MFDDTNASLKLLSDILEGSTAANTNGRFEYFNKDDAEKCVIAVFDETLDMFLLKTGRPAGVTGNDFLNPVTTLVAMVRHAYPIQNKNDLLEQKAVDLRVATMINAKHEFDRHVKGLMNKIAGYVPIKGNVPCIVWPVRGVCFCCLSICFALYMNYLDSLLFHSLFFSISTVDQERLGSTILPRCEDEKRNCQLQSWSAISNRW